MITSVTWPHPQYNLSHVTKFFSDVIDRIYYLMTFISKYLYFKKAWGLSLYQNVIYICIPWNSKTFWFPIKRCWCHQNSRVIVTWFISFLDLLWVRYNCVKFHLCRICVTDITEEGGKDFLGSPHPWAAPKSPSLFWSSSLSISSGDSFWDILSSSNIL